MIDIRNKDVRDAVGAQLERITESGVFAHADRLSKFLSYTVHATLDPARKSVTQFDIAMDVYDRDDNFDPTTDSLVRVEAGRLRAKLAEYYIDEGKDDPILIELPKGGYEANFEDRNPPKRSHGAATEPPAGRRGAAWLLLAAVAIALVVLAYFLAVDRSSPTDFAGRPETPTIAVLPFANLSDDVEQEYFSDGITEDIITDLSILSGLNVIARTSTFTYKDSPFGIRRIGEELGATHILEGSVQRAGDRLRITAQLIDVESESHLWAERYDRDFGDIFDVQDDVTRRIVGALQVALVGTEQERFAVRTTENIEAYDRFLRAKEQFYQFDERSVRVAINLFTAAIERDPGFAEAHAWKARALTYAYLAGFILSTEAALDPALHHARTAVELAPQSPVAHANLAWARRWNMDIDGALASIETAIGLDPNFSEALLWQSLILSSAGRGDDALNAIERSNRLNPNYGVTSIFALGRAHFELGEFDTALGYFDRVIDRSPSFLPTHVFRLAALEKMGNERAALAERETLARLNADYRESASYRYYQDHVRDRVRAD